MSLVPRWLAHLLVITLLGSGVPRASVRPTVLANPQPATAPVTLNDELPPLPDVPPVALPLVDTTSQRPTIPVTTTAPPPFGPLLTRISDPPITPSPTRPRPLEDDQTHAPSTPAVTPQDVSSCTGDATNPRAWWQRDATNQYEFLNPSNVDWSHDPLGVGHQRRFFQTDRSVGIVICLRPTEQIASWVPNATTWTTTWYRSATPTSTVPTIQFGQVTMTYRGIQNGKLAFTARWNTGNEFPFDQNCTATLNPCATLAPLNIDSLDLKRYPGMWRAVVTSSTGMTATPPDSVMINLTVTDYEASPNPINRATPTTLTTRFQATPPTRNQQGQPSMPVLNYDYDLYTPAGQHIMTLPHPTPGFDPSTATASFATSWNNQLTNPTRPITDGTYLVSFMFVFGEPLWLGWSEPAYIQAIWPLYVGVPATQLRNKGSCEFGCSPASYQVVAGDPVNTATGNFLHSETDLSIPTEGEPLTWTRSYNSQALTETSVLGPGWTHPFQLRLVLPTSPLGVSNQISLISPSGNHYTFRQSGSTYVPLPGVYAALTADAGGYTVSLPDLTRYRFDLLGRVTTVTTSRGASLQYQYVTSGPYTGLLDRITDASGQRFLALTYTGENATMARLASVRDPLNRTVTYGYQDGMLTTVTDVMGRITTYGLTDGLITTIDHAGVRTLTNVYETSTASVPIGHPSAWVYATAPALTACLAPTESTTRYRTTQWRWG